MMQRKRLLLLVTFVTNKSKDIMGENNLANRKPHHVGCRCKDAGEQAVISKIMAAGSAFRE